MGLFFFLLLFAGALSYFAGFGAVGFLITFAVTVFAAAAIFGDV